MSRFAKVTEEVLLRRNELAAIDEETRKIGKNANETLILYQLILLHSWDGGICKKNLGEICEIYGLDYDNSSRRVKILRSRGWLENTKKYLRPLLIDGNAKSKTVKNTVPEEDETVKNTVLEADETVKNTVSDCKNYSETDEKTVKNTVSFIPYKDSFKSENLEDPAAAENARATTAAAAAVGDNYLSKFSLEECLRYAGICKSRGDDIRSVEALATSARKTGKFDAFIEATLYPPHVEHNQSADAREISADDREIAEALSILRDVQAMGDDVRELEHFYAPEVWNKLMGEMEK